MEWLRNANSHVEELVKSVQCSICLDTLNFPVVSSCGHCFCKECLYKAMKRKGEIPCPLCKTAIKKRALREDKDLATLTRSIKRIVAMFKLDCNESGVTIENHDNDVYEYPATPVQNMQNQNSSSGKTPLPPKTPLISLNQNQATAERSNGSATCHPLLAKSANKENEVFKNAKPKLKTFGSKATTTKKPAVESLEKKNTPAKGKPNTPGSAKKRGRGRPRKTPLPEQVNIFDVDGLSQGILPGSSETFTMDDANTSCGNTSTQTEGSQAGIPAFSEDLSPIKQAKDDFNKPVGSPTISNKGGRKKETPVAGLLVEDWLATGKQHVIKDSNKTPNSKTPKKKITPASKSKKKYTPSETVPKGVFVSNQVGGAKLRISFVDGNKTAQLKRKRSSSFDTDTLTQNLAKIACHDENEEDDQIPCSWPGPTPKIKLEPRVVLEKLTQEQLSQASSSFVDDVGAPVIISAASVPSSEEDEKIREEFEKRKISFDNPLIKSLKSATPCESFGVRIDLEAMGNSSPQTKNNQNPFSLLEKDSQNTEVQKSWEDSLTTERGSLDLNLNNGHYKEIRESPVSPSIRSEMSIDDNDNKVNDSSRNDEESVDIHLKDLLAEKKKNKRKMNSDKRSKIIIHKKISWDSTQEIGEILSEDSLIKSDNTSGKVLITSRKKHKSQLTNTAEPTQKVTSNESASMKENFYPDTEILNNSNFSETSTFDPLLLDAVSVKTPKRRISRISSQSSQVTPVKTPLKKTNHKPANKKLYDSNTTPAKKNTSLKSTPKSMDNVRSPTQFSSSPKDTNHISRSELKALQEEIRMLKRENFSLKDQMTKMKQHQDNIKQDQEAIKKNQESLRNEIKHEKGNVKLEIMKMFETTKNSKAITYHSFGTNTSQSHTKNSEILELSQGEKGNFDTNTASQSQNQTVDSKTKSQNSQDAGSRLVTDACDNVKDDELNISNSCIDLNDASFPGDSPPLDLLENYNTENLPKLSVIPSTNENVNTEVDVEQCTDFNQSLTQNSVEINTGVSGSYMNLHSSTHKDSPVKPLQERKEKQPKTPVKTNSNKLSQINDSLMLTTQPKILGFLPSGIKDPKDLNKIRVLARKLSAKVCNKFDEDEVTHIIMKTDENMRCERTLKYLQGLASHKWILSFDWVDQCLKKTSRLLEEEFEMKGDNSMEDSEEFPPPLSALKSRLAINDKGLLEEYRVVCLPPITKITIDELNSLVRMSRAEVLDSLKCLKNKKDGLQDIILVDRDAEISQPVDYNALASRFNCKVVNCDWVIETIAAYEIQPIETYDVNVMDEYFTAD